MDVGCPIRATNRGEKGGSYHEILTCRSCYIKKKQPPFRHAPLGGRRHRHGPGRGELHHSPFRTVAGRRTEPTRVREARNLDRALIAPISVGVGM